MCRGLMGGEVGGVETDTDGYEEKQPDGIIKPINSTQISDYVSYNTDTGTKIVKVIIEPETQEETDSCSNQEEYVYYNVIENISSDTRYIDIKKKGNNPNTNIYLDVDVSCGNGSRPIPTEEQIAISERNDEEYLLQGCENCNKQEGCCIHDYDSECITISGDLYLTCDSTEDNYWKNDSGQVTQCDDGTVFRGDATVFFDTPCIEPRNQVDGRIDVCLQYSSDEPTWVYKTRSLEYGNPEDHLPITSPIFTHVFPLSQSHIQPNQFHYINRCDMLQPSLNYSKCIYYDNNLSLIHI